MHDPLVVAFEIPRPWPRRSGLPKAGNNVRWRIRLHHKHALGCEDDPPHGAFPWWKPSSYSRFWILAGREYYWPPLVTVWHREPGGHDALDICAPRRQRRDGTWTYPRTWRWHIHHWRLQVPPLQELRRRLLTRCAWCAGRHRKGDPVNVSHQWDRPRRRWWHGESGLFHRDCSAIERAHAMCLCTLPALEMHTYGRCARCDRYRPFGLTDEQLERTRDLASIPLGQRAAGGEVSER